MKEDKDLTGVPTLTDFDYALIVKGNQVGKVTKQQLAEVVGELIGVASAEKQGLASTAMYNSTPFRIDGDPNTRYINIAKTIYAGAKSFILSVSSQNTGTGNVILGTLRCNYVNSNPTLSRINIAGSSPEIYYKITNGLIYLLVYVPNWYHVDFCVFGTEITPIREVVSNVDGYTKFT